MAETILCAKVKNLRVIPNKNSCAQYSFLFEYDEITYNNHGQPFSMALDSLDHIEIGFWRLRSIAKERGLVEFGKNKDSVLKWAKLPNASETNVGDLRKDVAEVPAKLPIMLGSDDPEIEDFLRQHAIVVDSFHQDVMCGDGCTNVLRIKLKSLVKE